MQITPTNEVRSFNFESISGNTDDFTVTLQHVDTIKNLWVFDTVKSFILPNQARGDGKALQGLSTVDDIRMIINGSEIPSVFIHGGAGNAGRGNGEGSQTLNKGRFTIDQIAVPLATISNVGWTVVGAELLNEAVDDLSANSDGDETYISATDTSDTVTFSLEPTVDPQVDFLHSVLITSRSSGSQATERIELLILQNGVEVCNFGTFVIDRQETYDTEAHTCSAIEGSAITDYTGLEVQIINNNLNAGDEVRISKIEFLVPIDPNVEQFGQFTYNGTHNIIDVSLSKSLAVYTTNPHIELADIPINATRLDQVQTDIKDFAPTNTRIKNVDLFLSSVESYPSDSVRLDLIRDDFLLTNVTTADMLLRMDNDFYGIDDGLKTSSRVLAQIYIDQHNLNGFYDSIIPFVLNDTKNDVDEPPP